MSKNIKIVAPATPQAVDDRLVDIGCAAGWERAMLVALRVRLTGSGGAPDRKAKVGSHFCSPADFAALGIVGLRDPNTVRRYVRNWLEANGGEYPEYGKVCTLPTIEYPSEAAGDGEPTGGRPRASLGEIADRAARDPQYANDLSKRLADVQPEIVGRAAADNARSAEAVREREYERTKPLRDRQRRVHDASPGMRRGAFSDVAFGEHFLAAREELRWLTAYAHHHGGYRRISEGERQGISELVDLLGSAMSGDIDDAVALLLAENEL